MSREPDDGDSHEVVSGEPELTEATSSDEGSPTALSSRDARDLEESNASKKPLDEDVRFRCLWVVEAHMPSNVSDLISAFDRFGWEGTPITRQESIADFLSQARRKLWSGGWWDLGFIHPLDSTAVFVQRHEAVPDGIESIHCSLIQPAPAVSLVVWQFILTEPTSNLFLECLTGDLQTVNVPVSGGGHEIVSPYFKRRNLIGSKRTEIYDTCFGFIREHFPGVFSNDLLDGEFPTCELLTLKAGKPYSDAGGHWSYLSVLDVNSSWDAWTSDQLPGLVLDDSGRHELDFSSLLLVGNLHDIIAGNADTLDRNGPGDPEEALTSWLSRFDRPLGRWALWVIMRAYGRRASELRDVVASLRLSMLPLEEVDRLAERAFTLSADALPMVRDVTGLAANSRRFMMDAFEFNAHGENRRTTEYFDSLRKDIDATGVHLLDSVQHIRDVIGSAATLVNARASHELTAASLSLQRWTLALTWVLLGVGLLTIGITAWSIFFGG